MNQVKEKKMKYFATTILFVVMTLSGAIANTLPAGKPYPEFQVGITGINAAIKDGVLAVTKITPGTPAEGKLKAGDVLLAVNGTSLEIQDPRHPLGNAINKAEGSDGKIVFKVKRGDKKVDVTIRLKPIGSYSKTWPINCKKSQRIVDETAAFIIRQGGPEKSITGYCEGLFLLSTGEDKYLPVIKKFAHSVSTGKVGSHTWNNGYHGVFLGEYYLRTGDKYVLPTLKALCDDAKERQYYGGWNHWGGAGPGYVVGGLMNPAGVQVLTTLILARECGVDVDRGTYDRALTLFFRFAGHGAVPYGDHHPTMYLGDNGKNGMLACALTLLPDEKFQGAAQVLALDEVDSYTMNEQGHGSAFGNQTWRGLAGVLVTENMMANYRRHMDKLTWYYELCRMPGGGFKTPPMPGSGQGSIGRAPHHETGLISLAYTSHLKNLRITGNPRTKYSVKHRPTEVERNLPYTDSHKPDYVKGGSDMGLEPHEIYAKFSKKYGGWWNTPPAELMSVKWYATMMRHYNPIVRSCAAHGLGYLGEPAVPEILKALKSPDERLRVAGMEAISGLLFWGPAFTKVKITPDMIRKHFLPYILKPLKDPAASMWEKRHALYVLSRADKKTIAAQTSLIKPYLGDQEWYLRVAAFTAVRPLIQDTALIKPFLPAMFASYDVDTNLPSRRWGATSIFKEILAKNDDLRAEVIARMAKSVNRIKIRQGYKQPIDVNNIFETLRYIAMKKHPEHVIPILPAIQRVFPLVSGQAGNWIFTGAGWGNIGLIKAAAALGKDAGPVIASMKAMLPELKNRTQKGRDAKTYQTTLDAVTKAIEAYEKQYGVVKSATYE